MKLLLDSGFARHSADRGHSGVALQRWDGGEQTDEEVIASAAQQGCDGVVFIGQAAAARPEMVETLRKTGMLAVVTHSDAPTQAARHLESSLLSLRDSAKPGEVWLVLASGIRRVYPPRSA